MVEHFAPVANPFGKDQFDGEVTAPDQFGASATPLDSPVQLAQAGSASPAVGTRTEIGTVTKIEGQVTARHTDGTGAVLAQGAPVYQGDTLQTANISSITITFVDGTKFALGGNAQMVLNELVYNPATQSGNSLLSVIQGTFVFVTGQVAASGPDAMKVATPAGTIGIRGTKVGCVVEAGTAATTCVNLPKAAQPAQDGVTPAEPTFGSWVFVNEAATVVVNASNQAIIAFDRLSTPITSILSNDEIQGLFGTIDVTQAGPNLQFALSSGSVLIEPDLGALVFETRSSSLLSGLGLLSKSGQGEEILAGSTFIPTVLSSINLVLQNETGNVTSQTAPGGTIIGFRAPNMTSGGIPVVINQAGPTEVQGVLQGTGELVFTFTFDPNTGLVAFQEVRPLDHPLANLTGSADTITIVFEIEFESGTPNATTTEITVPIPDSGPVARPDVALATIEGQSALLTGNNLLQNDTQGADGASVTQITYDGGQSVAAVPANGAATVTTAFGGVLTVAADGTWSYQVPAGVPGTTNDDFQYRITDFDGDNSTATQSITVNNVGVGNVLTPDNLTSGGTPVIIQVVSPTHIQGVLQGSGAVVFDFQIDPVTDQFTFTSQLPFDNSVSGSTDITFVIAGPGGGQAITVQVPEGGGGTVSGSVQGDVTVTVLDSVPTANPGPAVVVTEGAPGLVTGTNLLANDDFGTDLPGRGVTSISYNGGATAVPSGGSVTVTTALGGVLAVGSDGTWSYDPPASVPNTGADGFTYTIQDSEGDASSAVQAITVLEDNTAITGDNALVSVAEANLTGGSSPATPVTAVGSVTIDFGPDSNAVAITGITGPSVSDPDDVANVGALTSLGSSLSYAETDLGNGARQLTATETATNTTVFTLTIQADGSYSFTLLQALDHPDANETGNADALDLSFTYTAAENVDSDTGTITIRVTDDGPLAIAATAVSVQEGGATIAGNLLANDTPGADGASLTHVQLPGGSFVAITSGTVLGGGEFEFTVAGLGSYTFRADGTWSFTPVASVDNSTGDVNASFLYRVTDTDGDSSQAGQQISISDSGVPTVMANAAVGLDDDALAGGNAGGVGDDADAVNVSGTLGHSFGADGGTIGWLTSGAPAGFSYVLSGNDLLVQQGGTTVLTVTLDPATGSYTVTQNAPISHGGADEDNQGFTLTYRVTDGDGDTADGTLSISVDDDTPTANADFAAATEGDIVPVTGNVLANDAQGADGATLASITFLDSMGVSQTVAVPQDGTSITVQTFLGGSLTVDQTGAYSYTAPAAGSISVDSQDIFTYALTDADGDSVSADLTVDVTATTERLTGQIVTNAPVSDQVLLLTFASLTDPTKIFQLTVQSPTGGQANSNVIIIDEATGFNIGNDQFMVSLEYISGDAQLQITDMQIGGITLFGDGANNTTNVNGNIKLGTAANEDEVVTAILQPSDPNFQVEGPYVSGNNTLSDVSDTGLATFSIGSDGAGDAPSTAVDTNIMVGGNGSDTLVGGPGADYLFGEQGNDVLTGNGGDDLLSGSTGDDLLSGGAGNDILVGGIGLDTITGGPDADTFRYFKMADGGAAETITDFNMAEGDKLDIHDLLENYDPATSIVSDYVSVQPVVDPNSGAVSTLVSVDTDGAATAAVFQPLVTLQLVSTDLTGLEQNLVLT